MGAVVERPDSGGVVLTGRLSMGAQPWLADHVVAGVVLFPGAGFVELVLRAGDEVGCSVVEELTLLAPLVLPVGRWGSGAGGRGCCGRVGCSGQCGCIRVAQAQIRVGVHAEGVLSAGSL